MRYRFLTLLLVLSLSACSFNVEVVTPQPSSTLPPATSPVLPSDVPSPTLVPTSILSPTVTLTQVITSTPLQRVGGVYPIQFPLNGTYVDIVDSLAARAGKTYSINAMKGQIMSISILVGPDNSYTIVPMKIIGADGTYICPDKENQNYGCVFWRGMLPATQDYFVTLTPDVFLSNFTMRVAINPPGVSNQSFSYESRDGVISFTYKDDFAPIRFRNEVIYKIWPEVSLEFIDIELLKDTNLSEAYFLFGSSKDPEIVASCTKPVSYGGLDIVTGEVNINDVLFTRSEASSAGAGNLYEQTYYRTAYQGSCYEVMFFVHSTNIGNYAPDVEIREFDRAALMQKMENILSTLVIK